MVGYTIVQFTEWRDGSFTSAVPISWIVNCDGHLMCYFPNKNAVSAIKNKAEVRADWPKYAVKRLTLKDIPTYELAMKKQAKSLETSGVDTSDVTDNERSHSVPRKLFKSTKAHQRENPGLIESKHKVYPLPAAPIPSGTKRPILCGSSTLNICSENEVQSEGMLQAGISCLNQSCVKLGTFDRGEKSAQFQPVTSGGKAPNLSSDQHCFPSENEAISFTSPLVMATISTPIDKHSGNQSVAASVTHNHGSVLEVSTPQLDFSNHISNGEIGGISSAVLRCSPFDHVTTPLASGPKSRDPLYSLDHMSCLELLGATPTSASFVRSELFDCQTNLTMTTGCSEPEPEHCEQSMQADNTLGSAVPVVNPHSNADEKLDHILSSLDEIKSTQAQLLQMLASLQQPSDGQGDLDLGTATLPATNDDAMDALAEALEVKARRRQLVGSDLSQIISNVISVNILLCCMQLLKFVNTLYHLFRCTMFLL